MRGVEILFLFFGDDHERYNLLKELGCSVYKLKDYEYKAIRDICVISDGNEILHGKASVRTARKSEAVYGNFYISPIDYSMINNLEERFSELFIREKGAFKPNIVEVANEDLIQRVRNVKFYCNKNIQIKEIDISKTIPTSSFVVPFKLRQAENLISFYEERGWKLFRPCGIKLKNQKVSLVVPPVIEEHKGKWYVVEGHSRIYTLKKMGVERVTVVFVSDVTTELPKLPTKWTSVIVADQKKEDRNHELARYIETSVHKDIWSVNQN